MKAFVLAAMAGFAGLGPAHAGERAATEAEIRRLVVGHVVKCGGADCHYEADGTFYRNGQDPGRYTVSAGSICVTSTSGSNRCDRIVVNDGAYSIISGSGQRLGFVRPDLPAPGAAAAGTSAGLRPGLGSGPLLKPLVQPTASKDKPAPGTTPSATTVPGKTTPTPTVVAPTVVAPTIAPAAPTGGDAGAGGGGEGGAVAQ